MSARGENRTPGPGGRHVQRHARRVALGLLVTAWLSAGPRAAPDPNWIVQITRTDCSGQAAQQTGPCESYATDLYEHVDYTVTPPGAATADIQTIHAGFDSDYYYFELDFVVAWDKDISTGHQVVIELDTDSATESGRGDYYVGLFQKEEFDSTSWIDADSQSGFEIYSDPNDDVGGGNPSASDFGGSEGDGYDGGVSQTSDMVWARIVAGNFQVAIKRTAVGDPLKMGFRPWSRQSTSLPKDKLYFHDQNDTSDVSQIDNVAGAPSTDWPQFAAQSVIKRAFLTDGTPLTDGIVVPAGTLVRFMLYFDNYSGPISDVSLQDVLGPTFAYQAGTMKRGLLAGASTTWCPAMVCDETAIFNETDTNGVPLGDGDAVTAPIDADAGSYNTGSSTVDLGDANNSNNAQQDVGMDTVLSLIFTVRAI